VSHQQRVRALESATHVIRNFRSMMCSSERAEAGDALPEYALVLALFSIAAMGGLSLLGKATSQILSTFQTNLNAYNLRHA